MPYPKFEGIAQHAIIPALQESGGKKLVDAIYGSKVEDGTTCLTHIHHRQTPMRVMGHECAAGAVWYPEAYFHADIAPHAIALVAIPDAHNKVVTHTAGAMRAVPRPRAAAFLKFLAGPRARAIYRKYGFMPPPHAAQ